VCWTLALALSNVLPAQAVYFGLYGLRRAGAAGDRRRYARGLAQVACFLQGVNIQGPANRLLARSRDFAGEDPYCLGVQQIFAGYYHLSTGNWLEAHQNIGLGIEHLQNQRDPAHFECGLGEGLRLFVLDQLGDYEEVRRRARQWLVEAVDRGDRMTAMVAGQFLAQASIPGENPEDYRTFARRSLEGWTTSGYTVQHFSALMIELECDLVTGRAAEGIERLEASRPAIHAANLHRFAIARIRYVGMECRLLLAARRDLRRVQRMIGTLRGMKRPDAPLWASALEGALLSQKGKDPRRQFREAAAGFQRLGMRHVEAAAAWWLAHWEGTATSPWEDQLRELGVAMPSSWIAGVIPAVIPLKSS
jgi:hypothetical protein